MKILLSKEKSLKLVTILLLVVVFSLTTVASTLVVSKDGEQYQSIQTAIDKANPGDTVLIEEGTYKANLTANKNLTLKGIGATKVKVDGVKKGRPVLRVGPSKVKVTVNNLTLMGAKGRRCTNEGNGFCPFGLSAFGKARVLLKDSIIKGNRDGIRLWDSTRATVKSSIISENKWKGIVLKDSSKTIIKGSEIGKNDEWGIGLYDNSEGIIKESDITENEAGIGIQGLSLAIIEDSKITENEEEGLVLYDSPNAILKSNSLQGNQLGVRIYEPAEFEGNLNGFRNKFTDNETNFKGVSEGIRKELLASMERPQGNVVLDNQRFTYISTALKQADPGDTVMVKEGTYRENLTVDKKVILRGAGSNKVKIEGVKKCSPVLHIGPSAVEVTLEGLTINNAKGGGCRFPYPPGLSVMGKSQVHLTDLTIMSNDVGINLWGSPQVSITASSISDNVYGIRLQDAAKAIIKDTEITGNKRNGIWLTDSTKVTVRKSEIQSNGFKWNDFSGIMLRDSSQASIRGSKITGNGDEGVTLSDTAQAKIIDSVISDNYSVGIDASCSSRFNINDSSITANKSGGVRQRGSSQSIIKGSKFTANKSIAIDIWDSSKTTIQESDITENEAGIGIDHCDSAQVTVTESVISGNEKYGVYYHADSTKTKVNLKCNTMRENKYGISMGTKGILQGSNNRITDNYKNFVGVSEFKQNELTS